jgi:pimeloyl-ACP methyl ester carboxylesterase
MTRIFAFVASIWLLGCSSLQTEGDFMFLRNEGADLPIWVSGNTASKVLIVWLSGGPGSPVSIVRGEATARLERNYGMVYWDQRGSGSAQGNPSPESFTMAQFVEDADKVVELVRQRYRAERIFLLGHSWGGTLGTAYLLDAQRQAKIAGFIDVGGNHDMPLVYPMKLAWLQSYAERALAADRDPAHWRKVRDFCASMPPLTEANFERWDDYVTPTNAAFHDPENGVDVTFDLLFRSGDSLPAYAFVNSDFVHDALFDDDGVRRSFSYSSRMVDITVPAALLWGTHDGIVPLPAALSAFDALGTPVAQKTLTQFERSAHFPFLEEPDAFAAAVEEFVEAHR